MKRLRAELADQGEPLIEKITSDKTFQITIPQPATFRAMIENVANVLKTVELIIVAPGDKMSNNDKEAVAADGEQEEFVGIKVETLDEFKACLVIAQFPCSVQVCQEWQQLQSHSLSLTIEYLLNTLRQVELQYSLVIEQTKGEDDVVVMRAYESIVSGDELTARLRKLVEPSSHTIKLKDLKVDFQLEMDLQTMRSFLKSCDAIKSEDIELTLTEFTTEDGGTMEVVSMATNDKGTMKLKRVFRSCIDEGGSRAPVGEGKVVFHEAFATKYLNNFVRSMNRTNVVLQMSPGAPLHVSLCLGHRDATIRFILAPKAVETE